MPVFITLSSPITILAFQVNDLHVSNVTSRFGANAWIIFSCIITSVLFHLISVHMKSDLVISKYSKGTQKNSLHSVFEKKSIYPLIIHSKVKVKL